MPPIHPKINAYSCVLRTNPRPVLENASPLSAPVLALDNLLFGSSDGNASSPAKDTCHESLIHAYAIGEEGLTIVSACVNLLPGMQALLSLGSGAERVQVREDAQAAIVIVAQMFSFSTDSSAAVAIECSSCAEREIAPASISCSLVGEKGRLGGMGRYKDGKRLRLQVFIVKAIVQGLEAACPVLRWLRGSNDERVRLGTRGCGRSRYVGGKGGVSRRATDLAG